MTKYSSLNYQQLLERYANIRNHKRILLSEEYQLRKEINSRSSIQTRDIYPKKPVLSPDQIKKLSKIIRDNEQLKTVLEIIEKKENNK